MQPSATSMSPTSPETGTRVDTTDHRIVAQITGFTDVRGLSLTRDGARLFAANSGDDTISFVDTGSGRTIRTVKVGAKPYGAVVSPDEKLLFSGNMRGNSLTALDPATGAVLGTVEGLFAPRQAIAWRRDSRVAWALNEDLTIAEVDVDRLAVIRTIGANR